MAPWQFSTPTCSQQLGKHLQPVVLFCTMEVVGLKPIRIGLEQSAAAEII
jgi:hypothetical protein